MKSQKAKKAEPIQKVSIGGGWRGKRSTRPVLELPSIEPASIGYVSNFHEIMTFNRRQRARIMETMSDKGAGLLTQSDVDRIEAARRKRVRKARNPLATLSTNEVAR